MIDQIISWLSTPQGNLLYSAWLGIFALAALVASWYASRVQVSAERRRVQLTLLALFFVQVILFTSSWLAWLGMINGRVFLPPFDRSIALFSLVLIIWLWAFPRPKSSMVALIITLEVVIVLAGAISIIWWRMQDATASFTTSLVGGYAYFTGGILLVVGLILLLWRRPASWGFGLAMLAIILAGYVGQYFVPQKAGDYGWLVRLGEILGYPFLMAIPRRLIPHHRYRILNVEETPASSGPTQVVEGLIKDVIDLRGEVDQQRYYQKLTRLVAQLMDADICLLLMPPKVGGQLIIPTGYNLREDWEIDGFTVDGNKMPLLLNALQTGNTLLQDDNQPGSEVRVLTSELAFGQSTHLMEVPFKPQGSATDMGIAVLSRISYPAWIEKDAARLTEMLNTLLCNVAQPVTPVVPMGEQADMTKTIQMVDKAEIIKAVRAIDQAETTKTVQEGDRAEMSKILQAGDQAEVTKALQRAQAEVEKMRIDYTILKTAYDKLSTRIIEVAEKAEASTTWPEEQKKLQETIAKLEARNLELENMINRGRPSSEEVDQLREELKAALADLARMPSTLSKSDQRMLETQLTAVRHLDAVGPVEVINSISQEFRQPLSSILGYTDLLLGETVGLLGAMQRKFLERIKASTERLGMLMNELMQVLVIDGGILDQTPSTIEVEGVIDEAIEAINAQVKEKNITLQVDTAGKLPPVQANRDALQQILANLLQNACLATPENGEISLVALQEKKENEPNYLLISVTDQGGGIAESDIPHVFMRRYKVENPLIQGVGDTGVGLSIVKSLVELLKGRIWVDTQPGVGSTFSVLLPLAESATVSPKQAAKSAG